MIYLRILKALYGCIKSALLWHDLYANTLKELGFVVNPYYQLVTNKIIDGKQCTIIWYVNDKKLSHVDLKVNTIIVEVIAKIFGDLVITRVKITLS